MSGETPIAIVGGITADPERKGSADSPFVTFSVASTPRVFDRDSNEWKDGETTYWDCSAGGPLALAVASEYRKGSQVIIIGQVATRRWTDSASGEARSKMGIRVQEIGTKLGRSSSRDGTPASQPSQQAVIPPGRGAAAAGVAADEPWAAAVPGAGYSIPDDTPF